MYVQGETPNADSLHQCRFSQCRDLWLLPAKISHVRQRTKSIEIDFKLDKPRVLAEIGLDKLRIHLNGATYTTHQLFYLLSHRIKQVTLVTEHHRLPLDNFAALPVGFKKEDALLPYPKIATMGIVSCKSTSVFLKPLCLWILKALKTYL